MLGMNSHTDVLIVAIVISENVVQIQNLLACKKKLSI